MRKSNTCKLQSTVRCPIYHCNISITEQYISITKEYNTSRFQLSESSNDGLTL